MLPPPPCQKLPSYTFCFFLGLSQSKCEAASSRSLNEETYHNSQLYPQRMSVSGFPSQAQKKH